MDRSPRRFRRISFVFTGLLSLAGLVAGVASFPSPAAAQKAPVHTGVVDSLSGNWFTVDGVVYDVSKAVITDGQGRKVLPSAVSAREKVTLVLKDGAVVKVLVHGVSLE